MIKNVFLDLDDTILDFHKAEKEALKKTLSDLSIPASEEVFGRYSTINLMQWKLLEKGEITREELKKRRYRILFDELGVKEKPEEAAGLYEKYLSCGHFFVDGAENLLKKLYGTYRLYLVSNGTQIVQKGRMKSADIEKYFSQIFISQEIGYNKPDKRFFEFCFGKIPDLKKEESVIAGDSLSSDIAGGINAGIRTIWFNPSGTEVKECMAGRAVQPDYEIRSLTELPELLLKL